MDVTLVFPNRFEVTYGADAVPRKGELIVLTDPDARKGGGRLSAMRVEEVVWEAHPRGLGKVKVELS